MTREQATLRALMLLSGRESPTLEDLIAGIQQGWAEGYSEGDRDGYANGYANGYTDGFTDKGRVGE